MDELASLLGTLRNIVWSPPLLALIIGVSLYLTWKLGGLQFRYLIYSLKQVFTRSDDDSSGDISQFQALMTALAGAIGTGSIVGVSTGIAIGGMGALFWMWVTALLGMATRYSESLMAVKYRHTDSEKQMIGGPMEYIKRGLGWKRAAAAFAGFGCVAAIGTGNLVQVNSIGDALHSMVCIDPWVTGVILFILTSVIVFGGVQVIGRVAGVLVPVMAIFYVCGGLLVIARNYGQLPSVFSTIIQSAFSGQAATGGFVGSTLALALQFGVARSVFSNEAGLGVSSIAAAAARTDHPGRQAMISMTGAFLSTIIVCTITGLVIGVTGVFGDIDESGQMISGALLAIRAFSVGIPGGETIVAIGLILFAYSTVLAWAYYGEKCAEYLFGIKGERIYRFIYVLLVIPGAALDLQVVWRLADVFNGLMAIPNLLALAALAPVIAAETNEFLTIVEGEEKEGRSALVL